MKTVRVTKGLQAQKAILDGVAEMAHAVGVTYGPCGRTVMLDRAGGLLATKDGVTVAWELEPKDPLRRLGTRVVQEACSKVNKLAGDGTTTTAILIHAILKEAHKLVAAGENPAMLAQDLLRVSAELTDLGGFDILDPISVEQEGLLYEIALGASNQDGEVAKAIVEAMDMVGSQGLVSIEEGKGRGIELVLKSGLETNRGLESTDFLGADGSPRVFDTALVALVDGELTKLSDVQNLVEQATQFPHPLVIVSRGCFGEALKVLCMNDRKLECPHGQTLQCVAVRVPGRADQQRAYLEDLAALTGARVLDPKVESLDQVPSNVLGSIQTGSFTRTTSTFVAFEDKYEGIERRVSELQWLKDRTTSTFDVEQLNERIAKLSNGFCLMLVGAVTQTEIRERRGRIEDALNAVRCAIQSGIVPGGGISYLILSCILGDGMGDRVLREALKSPLTVLARNAGFAPEVILGRVLEASRGSDGPIPSWETGWDAITNTVRDFRTSPVIAEPLEVVKAIVRTAISTASTLLTAEVAITKI